MPRNVEGTSASDGGLYRLRDYPTYPREEVAAAWLAIGKDIAVVSHDSALDLHPTSSVTSFPNSVHLTVPRIKTAYAPNLPGITIHTTTKPFNSLDLVTRDGMQFASAGRTILDAAEWGTGPEQIEMAIHQAIHRGLITRNQLIQDALRTKPASR